MTGATSAACQGDGRKTEGFYHTRQAGGARLTWPRGLQPGLGVIRTRPGPQQGIPGGPAVPGPVSRRRQPLSDRRDTPDVAAGSGSREINSQNLECLTEHFVSKSRTALRGPRNIGRNTAGPAAQSGPPGAGRPFPTRIPGSQGSLPFMFGVVGRERFVPLGAEPARLGRVADPVDAEGAKPRRAARTRPRASRPGPRNAGPAGGSCGGSSVPSRAR